MWMIASNEYQCIYFLVWPWREREKEKKGEEEREEKRRQQGKKAGDGE